jgi:hypothetical protein
MTAAAATAAASEQAIVRVVIEILCG